MKIGYHASHEQFSPSDLLHYVQLAEKNGFDAVMSSDHIAPWSVRQGHSGHTVAWLGAALQATQKMTFGALAIPGGFRAHPAVLAQAYATLALMFPNRMSWIAAGSGEAMNEFMVKGEWPDKDMRDARLEEGVKIIQALWRGEIVDKPHGLIPTFKAKLWSGPKTSPHIIGAVLSPHTAHEVAEWAHGLITVRQDKAKLSKILDCYKQAARILNPMALQLQLSWNETKDKARMEAHHQWRHVAATEIPCADTKTTEEFDRLSANVVPAEMDDALLVTDSADEIIAHIHEYQQLGFDEIYLHNAGRNQAEFIEFYGRYIAPEFKNY